MLFAFSVESVFPDSYLLRFLCSGQAPLSEPSTLFVCYFSGSLRASFELFHTVWFVFFCETYITPTDSPIATTADIWLLEAGGSSKRQDESSERGLSLNRSQRGNCSTEYNTPLGT